MLFEVHFYTTDQYNLVTISDAVPNASPPADAKLSIWGNPSNIAVESHPNFIIYKALYLCTLGVSSHYGMSIHT